MIKISGEKIEEIEKRTLKDTQSEYDRLSKGGLHSIREFTELQLMATLQNKLDELKTDFRVLEQENIELKAKLKQLESNDSHICTGELPY